MKNLSGGGKTKMDSLHGKLASLEDVRNIFTGYSNSYLQVLADMDHAQKERVIYSFDFSILHPYIFGPMGPLDSHYDAVGRNIFSLIGSYKRSLSFIPAMSVPSLLELIDQLAHRAEKFVNLSESREKLNSFISNFREQVKNDRLVATSSDLDPLSFLLSIKLTQNAEHLSNFIKMMKSNTIEQLSENIDIELFQTAEFKKVYNESFDKMFRKRSKTDNRDFNDKVFHYRVDSWNIASAVISKNDPSVEIDHVCSDKPGEVLASVSEFARSPVVPGISLYALLRTPSEGYVRPEAEEFIQMGARELCDELKRLTNRVNVGEMSFTQREEIDRLYDKYIRPVFADYSRSNISEAHATIRELENNRYASITTEEGLRDRFRADADNTRNVAISFLEESKITLDDKLLTSYTLNGNARIDEIKRKLGL
ncbi:hypothetical protein LC612_33740 [Nostoc sp. CHAB 5834]|nr:hypothetical protein [Nostoc sp. CHAB 5834]